MTATFRLQGSNVHNFARAIFIRLHIGSVMRGKMDPGLKKVLTTTLTLILLNINGIGRGRKLLPKVVFKLKLQPLDGESRLQPLP